MTAPRRKDQHGNQADADDQRAEGVHQVAKGETLSLPLPIVFRHLPIVRVATSDTGRDLNGWELRQSFPRPRGVIGITRGPALITFAVLVVVGLLAGCGSATSADTSCVGSGCRPIAVVVASSVIHDGRTRIVGGTPAQRALLHTILEGISSRDVPEVTVGPPPGTSLMGGGTWLIFHYPGDENRSQLGEWESWLVAGAFRDLSAARGLPAVKGDGVVFHPDVGSGYERLCCAAHHVTSAASRQALTRRITEGVKRAELTLISIRFARPFHLAPIVIAKTSDPNARLGSWMPKSSPYGDDSKLEGAFLEVRNQAGKVVFFVGHSTRTQTGIGSIGLSGPAPSS